MTEKNRSKKGNIISFAVMLIIIGLTLYLIFRDYSPAMIFQTVKENNLIYIGLALILMLVYVLLEAASIRTITRSFGEKTSYRKAISYSASDLYFSAITPSSEGGQPMMIYAMKRDGISISRSTVTAVLFTNMFTSGLLICTGIAIILHPELLYTDDLLFKICFILGVVVSVILFVGCLLLLRFGHTMEKLGVKIIGFLHKIHLIRNEEKYLRKLKVSVADFAACSEYIKAHPILTVKVLILATLQRIVYFSVPYFIYLSFGFTRASFFYIFAVQAITQIAVYAMPIPGSAGITEKMLILMYEPIYYSEDLAISAMLLVRAATFYFTVFFCGTITLIDNMVHKKTQREESL